MDKTSMTMRKIIICDIVQIDLFFFNFDPYEIFFILRVRSDLKIKQPNSKCQIRDSNSGFPEIRCFRIRLGSVSGESPSGSAWCEGVGSATPVCQLLNEPRIQGAYITRYLNHKYCFFLRLNYLVLSLFDTSQMPNTR